MTYWGLVAVSAFLFFASAIGATPEWMTREGQWLGGIVAFVGSAVVRAIEEREAA